MNRIARWLCITGVLCCAASAALAQAPAATPAKKPAATSATHSRTKHMTTDPALLHPSHLTAKAPDVYEVKFATTKGDFVVQVNRAWAPIGADRFYNLVHHHFLDRKSVV